MGDVRAMNVWLSLSHCGDDAPGLDLLPRRLDDFLPDRDRGGLARDQVSDSVAGKRPGRPASLRPIFEPGDALLFDELFLHQTASDPSMPNVATRSRCGSSVLPASLRSYAPVAF